MDKIKSESNVILKYRTLYILTTTNTSIYNNDPIIKRQFRNFKLDETDNWAIDPNGEIRLLKVELVIKK